MGELKIHLQKIRRKRADGQYKGFIKDCPGGQLNKEGEYRSNPDCSAPPPSGVQMQEG